MSWLDSIPPGESVNKRALGKILGVSEETLTEWLGEGMPVTERGSKGVSGKYDTAAVIRWACIRELNKRNAQTSFEKLNDVRYRRELLNLRRDEGEIVLREEIRPAFRRYVEDVLATLLGIPDKYAQAIELTESIDGKRQVLEDIVAEIRDVLGNYEFSAAFAAGGNTRVSQSAEDHPGAVG